MSASSNEERDSIARRTNQSRNSHLASNLITSMDDQGASNFGPGAPTVKKDHRKFDKEKPKPFLDWNDFLYYMDESIQGDRPEIIDDIVYHLTGVELVPLKQSIREEDEFPMSKALMPDHHNDEELANHKKTIAKAQYQAITSVFA